MIPLHRIHLHPPSRCFEPSPSLRGWLAAALICIGAAAAHAQSAFTVSLSPNADAFVRSADPAQNYGGGGAVSVSGAAAVNGAGQQNGLFDALLRFPLGSAVSSFDTTFGAGNWAISAVTLRLTEVAAPNNAIFNRGVGMLNIAWLADDGWAEGTGTPATPTTDGVTWNNLPSLTPVGGTVGLGTFANAGQNGTLSFSLPLTDLMFPNDLGSGSSASLLLSAANDSIGFTFNSRTFATASVRPVLEVTAVPEPGTTLLLALGGVVALGGRFYRARRHESA